MIGLAAHLTSLWLMLQLGSLGPASLLQFLVPVSRGRVMQPTTSGKLVVWCSKGAVVGAKCMAAAVCMRLGAACVHGVAKGCNPWGPWLALVWTPLMWTVQPLTTIRQPCCIPILPISNNHLHLYVPFHSKTLQELLLCKGPKGNNSVSSTTGSCGVLGGGVGLMGVLIFSSLLFSLWDPCRLQEIQQGNQKGGR